MEAMAKRSTNVKPERIPTGHSSFPQPKKFPECRICKVLQNQGGSAGLFQNHVSDYATGCPVSSLGTEQRFVIVKEAKLCSKCMRKDITASREHCRSCSVNEKKHSYRLLFTPRAHGHCPQEILKSHRK